MPSLVSTVLNDRQGLALFFERMAAQTRMPEEVIIVDGGSNDGTWELLLDESRRIHPWSLVAIQDVGCNVARGRNLAVAAASNPTIVSTDIGCDWEPRYFEELVAPFDTQPELEGVLGSWQVLWKDQVTPWAQADPLLRTSLELRATPKSHSSSRAIAYTKKAYLEWGGLPEDLSLACDDLALALIIQSKAKALAAAPEPRCVWFRPQTFRALKKEAYRNFKGAGEAGIGFSYFARNVARFMIEWLSLAGLGLCLLKEMSVLALFFFGLFLLMVVWRMRHWVPHWLTIRKRGGVSTLGHVALLDYATRWAAIRGYWNGFCRGAQHCALCRSRLRACGIGWW